MLLLAVSGGIDSMYLAWKVRSEGGPFAIAHCNFGLRGKESDGDEAFVRAWARGACVTCHVKRFDTKAFASAEGISIEMAARRLRYRWFGELCREHGYEAVAVAHNANDNAETLILNLLRGTGVKGLTGMKATGTIPDPEYADIPLRRPLLGMTREEIEAAAREAGISWREDSSNAGNDFKRNKIRNLVFPVFREINPRFVEVLNRDMERIEEEIHSALPGLGMTIKDPEEVSPVIPSETGESHTEEEYEVTEEAWDGTLPVKQVPGVLILDADKAGELVEGRWEAGDWIKPLGAPGRKKLQDWFTDHHVPADEKPFVKLFKSASEPSHVLAVAGRCIDHSVRVTKGTRRIIRISPKI